MHADILCYPEGLFYISWLGYIYNKLTAFMPPPTPESGASRMMLKNKWIVGTSFSFGTPGDLDNISYIFNARTMMTFCSHQKH